MLTETSPKQAQLTEHKILDSVSDMVGLDMAPQEDTRFNTCMALR